MASIAGANFFSLIVCYSCEGLISLNRACLHPYLTRTNETVLHRNPLWRPY